MSPAQLLAHFDRISEAPGAVARLRRFVVSLAVRGRLVEQDPRDGLRIHLPDSSTSNPKIESGHESESEARHGPFELPASWVWATTDSVCEAIVDCPHSTPRFVERGVPCIDTNCFKNGALTPTKIRYVSEETYLERVRRLAPRAGDVVFAREGSVGAAVVVPEGMRCCLGQRVMLFRAGPSLLSKYFEMAISEPSSLDRLLALHKGIGARHVNVADMRKALVPLPPISEQHRIVARVNEFMALCDWLEAAQAERERRRDRLVAASLNRLNEPRSSESREHVQFHLNHLPRLTTRREHIKELRETILKLAVRGRLVAQAADDGCATDVVQSAVSADERPFEIPQSWRWSRLKLMGHLKGGGTPSKGRDDYWNGDIPWVSPKDMKRDYIERAQMTITPKALAESAATMNDAGSLLFVVRGMILAHGFPVAIARVPLSVNQDMKVLTLHRPEYGEFLLRALKGLREQMLCKVKRSSHGTCRIEGADYSNFLLPIPPLAEQRRIVAKVDELIRICDKLEAQLSTVETESTRLLEATLHQALAVA